ncbi:MAG: sulfate adenylyltransferase [Firmicutes bacterium]|nr:sulfate adenylyltransferase [Bacillota bacterium]
MRDLLKFITCGSVDDGKSTLIGHLLYDSKLLYADQKQAIELDSKVGSRGGKLDYSLLLDGLTEEREQGITIDVAYRYFTTDVRSFVVADTPGHEEYTRNMAVGASFADLAVILIDASKGVLDQTRRHARICSIMGIRHFLFAVNKMDLVDYSNGVFRKIRREIAALQSELELTDVTVIPVSATEGDNIVQPSENTRWYSGKTLLDYLESVEIAGDEEQGFYLPVQRVCRPDHTFRGFQGQIESGQITVGDEITALPNGERARISRIFTGDRPADTAFTGQAVTVQLDREIDVSRGSVLTREAGLETADCVVATLLWMDDRPLTDMRNCFVKVGTTMIPGVVTKILYAIDINTGAFRQTRRLEKNEIAACRISFMDRVAVDRFQDHRGLGELILIDRITNMTSACGVIEQYELSRSLLEGQITAEARGAAMGQRAATVVFRRENGFDRDLLESAERQLILDGRHTYLLEAGEEENREALRGVIHHLNQAGIVVLLLDQGKQRLRQATGGEARIIVYTREETDADSIAAFVKRVSSYDDEITAEALYI